MSSIPPPQESAHANAKSDGPGSAGKLKPRNLFNTTTTPDPRIPLPEGFLRQGETHSEFNYRNNCWERDFYGVITPERNNPGF